MKVFPINNIAYANKNNSTSSKATNFGNVVPVNIIVNGKPLPHEIAKINIFKKIIKIFIDKINQRTENGDLNELAIKYGQLDSDFLKNPDTELYATSVDGSNWDSIRYITSGEQAKKIKLFRHNLNTMEPKNWRQLLTNQEQVNEILNAKENRIENKGITIKVRNHDKNFIIEDFIVESSFSPFEKEL